MTNQDPKTLYDLAMNNNQNHTSSSSRICHDFELKYLGIKIFFYKIDAK